MKQIVVANSAWSNIGNAFFMNSIIADLNLVFGDRAIVHPGEEAPFHANSPWGGRRSSFFDYSLYAQADWYVLSGPIFDRDFREKYTELFEQLSASGTKIVMLSVGSNHYDEEEIAACRGLLERHPPYIFSTRDSRTLELYGELAEHKYDGICSAYYSSIHFPGFDTPRLDPNVAIGFEFASEPRIRIRSRSRDPEEFVAGLEIDASTIRPYAALGRVLDNLRTYPSEIDGFRVIRPFHEPVSKLTLLAYNRPNTFVSLNPFSYLNIFRNTYVTLSQRVHACVATLSYQRPAMLFFQTKRSSLFERLGLEDVTTRPVVLPREVILREHEGFVDFLSSVPI